MTRVDDAGAAYAGSQLQTQLYVSNAEWRPHLDQALRELPGLEDAVFDWRSPLTAASYAEYNDAAFLRALDLEDLAGALAAFWPDGGPHWDALATVQLSGSPRPGVLLVEGKSYPAEFFGSGCQAGAASRNRIEKALGWTQDQLGVSDRSPADWCGRLYQNANRLAHKAWLESQGVDAWLVYLLFLDDPHGPTSAEEWHDAVTAANEELGISGINLPRVHHVLLPAGTREHLLGSSQPEPDG